MNKTKSDLPALLTIKTHDYFSGTSEALDQIKKVEEPTDSTNATNATEVEEKIEEVEEVAVAVEQVEVKEIDAEKLAEIDAVIGRYEKGVSVFYKDLLSGEEYFYNPDEKYFVASVIKAPYMMYVYRLVLDGTADLSEVYMYIETDYREGTGKIKEMAYGTEFTLNELIYYALRWSDNIAMDKIREAYPASGFIQFSIEIGVPHIWDIHSAVNADICARCAAVYIEEIYNFIEEGNLYSESLKEHMLNTINKMIYAKHPTARKYGWAENAYHDLGIVYNPDRPYLIVILSDRGIGDLSMFIDISLAVERYNDSKAEQETGDITEESLF